MRLGLCASALVIPLSEDWSEKVVVEKSLLDASQFERLLAQSKLLREEPWVLITVCNIKDAINNGDDMGKSEAWSELEVEQQNALWLAPTYGGLFTTEERKQLRLKGAKDEANKTPEGED